MTQVRPIGNNLGLVLSGTDVGKVVVIAPNAIRYDSGLVETGVVSGSPAPTVAWSTTDKNDNTATYSNSDLTITTTGAGFRVRATVGKTSGKWYWEVTKPTNASYIGPMVVKGTQSLNGGPGYSALWAVVYGFGANNGTYYNSVTLNPSADTAGSGTVTRIALDLDNLKLWFAKGPGLWNNTVAADPTLNLGGIDLTPGGAGTWYPGLSFDVGTAGNTMTGNFGATAFTYSLPSGFTAYGN